MGLSHPALRSVECHRTSGWLWVSWSMLSALVSPGLIAGWSCSRISAPATVLAQDRSAVTCSLSHAGPPRWCTTKCPVSSGWSSSACTAMCGSCGTPVATSRAVPRGSPRGSGWPAPLALSPTRPGAALVPPLGCIGRLWSPATTASARGAGGVRVLATHVRVGLLVLAFREYVAEDVHEGRWRVVRRPPRGGGQAVPAAVAPTWRCRPSGVTRGPVWASCLALVGWTSLRRGSRVPVVWKRWARASRHPGWLVGPCSWRQ